jgi:hypothetical protein
MLKKLFNSNTGYFLNTQTYYYKGNFEIGYILCKGYKIFGIHGYRRLNVFVDKNEAEAALTMYNFVL